MIFSIDRALNDKSPVFDRVRAQRSARGAVAAGRLPQDRRLQGRAADQGHRHDHAVAAQPLSDPRARPISIRSAATGKPIASLLRAPAREDEGVDTARARRVGAQQRLLGQGTNPQDERMVLLPIPDVSTRTAALLSGRVDWIEAPAPDSLDKLRAGGCKIETNAIPHMWPYTPQHAAGCADGRHPRAQGAPIWRSTATRW